MSSSSKIFRLPFLYKEQVAEDTYSFYFDRVKRGSVGRDTDFSFLPGQYIQLTLPHKNADDRGTNRFFTIASSPLEKKNLMITVRLLKSTFKKTLFELVPGKQVNFFGPMGKFVMNEKTKKRQVFISGGIGITPFHSMLMYIDKKKLTSSFTLFAFFSKKEECLFYDQLMQVAQTNTNVEIVYSVTGEKKDWQGEKSKLSKELLAKYIPDWQKSKYFITGSPAMVHHTKELLGGVGLSEAQLMTEDFTGY